MGVKRYIYSGSAQTVMVGPSDIWQQRKAKLPDDFNMNYFA